MLAFFLWLPYSIIKAIIVQTSKNKQGKTYANKPLLEIRNLFFVFLKSRCALYSGKYISQSLFSRSIMNFCFDKMYTHTNEKINPRAITVNSIGLGAFGLPENDKYAASSIDSETRKKFAKLKK
jgi:hypothetical protein